VSDFFLKRPLGSRKIRRQDGVPITSYSLATLGLSGMTRLGMALRGLGAGAGSMEEVAERVVGLLYSDLTETASDAPAWVLVRFCTTVDYERRDRGLRECGAIRSRGTAGIPR
jgi:hypothetical protein